MRQVVVLEYDPMWPTLFEAEATKLREVFGHELIEIYHIGSTSVPGLWAKSIIDIMPVVKDIGAVDALTEKMVELGYEAMGEFGIVGRRYFRKGGDSRTHHVHVFQVGSSDAERHLAFRDYLRAHPKEAKAYGDLKQSLARRFAESIEAYMDGKHDFIQRLEAEALKWSRSR